MRSRVSTKGVRCFGCTLTHVAAVADPCTAACFASRSLRELWRLKVWGPSVIPEKSHQKRMYARCPGRSPKGLGLVHITSERPVYSDDPNSKARGRVSEVKCLLCSVLRWQCRDSGAGRGDEDGVCSCASRFHWAEVQAPANLTRLVGQ